VSNFSGLLFTDKDRPAVKGYVSFAHYSAGLQKCPYGGRWHELSCTYVKYNVM
jgi:hypothetical protein